VNETKKLNQFLYELGGSLGVQGLQLNDDHLCAFEYKGLFELIVMSPPLSETLYLASVMGNVEEAWKIEIYEKILEMNFLLMDARGCAFSVDPGSPRVVLCYAQGLHSMDATSFMNVVGNFIETSEKMHAEISGFIDGLRRRSPEGSPQGGAFSKI
jgi:hypothetical protein